MKVFHAVVGGSGGFYDEFVFFVIVHYRFQHIAGGLYPYHLFENIGDIDAHSSCDQRDECAALYRGFRNCHTHFAAAVIGDIAHAVDFSSVLPAVISILTPSKS